MKLTVLPTETVDDVINRYPLSVEYFVESGYESDDWDIEIDVYVRERDMTFNQLEQELEDHLQKAVRPEPEECKSISCKPLPFCPDEVSLAPHRSVRDTVEKGLGWLRDLLNRSP